MSFVNRLLDNRPNQLPGEATSALIRPSCADFRRWQARLTQQGFITTIWVTVKRLRVACGKACRSVAFVSGLESPVDESVILVSTIISVSGRRYRRADGPSRPSQSDDCALTRIAMWSNFGEHGDRVSL